VNGVDARFELLLGDLLVRLDGLYPLDRTVTSFRFSEEHREG